MKIGGLREKSAFPSAHLFFAKPHSERETTMTFWTKSILSLILAGSALIGLLSMFELMGRKEKRLNPKMLRIIHRANGIFFFLFFLFLSYYCLKIMRGSGQELSPRAALHGLLATATFLLLCLKISIVRFYRQYFSMAVPLGISVVLLALATTATSAGYYFTMRGGGASVSATEIKERTARQGAVVFNQNCADCHYADKAENKIGPGLKGLFKREKLPVSGRPVTDANVRKQVKTPFQNMPAFGELPEGDMDSLMAFLNTL